MINAKSLEKQSKDLDNRIKDIEQNVYKYAKKEFNISSPKQLADLFNEEKT